MCWITQSSRIAVKKAQDIGSSRNFTVGSLGVQSEHMGCWNAVPSPKLRYDATAKLIAGVKQRNFGEKRVEKRHGVLDATPVDSKPSVFSAASNNEKRQSDSIL